MVAGFVLPERGFIQDALLVLVSGLELMQFPLNRRSSLSSARYSVFQ